MLLCRRNHLMPLFSAVPTTECWTERRLRTSITSSTRSPLARVRMYLGFLSQALYSRFSLTVKSSCTMSSCKTCSGYPRQAHYKDTDSTVNAGGLQMGTSHSFCAFEFPQKLETAAQKSHSVHNVLCVLERRLACTQSRRKSTD